jgi:hypothetical protein
MNTLKVSGLARFRRPLLRTLVVAGASLLASFSAQSSAGPPENRSA